MYRNIFVLNSCSLYQVLLPLEYKKDEYEKEMLHQTHHFIFRDQLNGVNNQYVALPHSIIQRSTGY